MISYKNVYMQKGIADFSIIVHLNTPAYVAMILSAIYRLVSFSASAKSILSPSFDNAAFTSAGSIFPIIEDKPLVRVQNNLS